MMGNHNMVSFTVILLVVLTIIVSAFVFIRWNGTSSKSSFNNLDPSLRLGAGDIAGPNYPGMLQDGWYMRETFVPTEPQKDCKACGL